MIPVKDIAYFRPNPHINIHLHSTHRHSAQHVHLREW